MCGLFHVLAQFPFTTKEPELDYYRQQVKVRVASRFAQQLKTLEMRKLGSSEIRKFQENS